ncbi:MAG: hypothetical protein R3C68_04365 [Myxococcota bacterium]
MFWPNAFGVAFGCPLRPSKEPAACPEANTNGSSTEHKTTKILRFDSRYQGNQEDKTNGKENGREGLTIARLEVALSLLILIIFACEMVEIELRQINVSQALKERIVRVFGHCGTLSVSTRRRQEENGLFAASCFMVALLAPWALLGYRARQTILFGVLNEAKYLLHSKHSFFDGAGRRLCP